MKKLVRLFIIAVLIVSLATAQAGPLPAPARPAPVHLDTHGNIVLEPNVTAKPAGMLDRVVQATEQRPGLDQIVEATESRGAMQLAGVIAATEAKRGYEVAGEQAAATMLGINTITSVVGSVVGGIASGACTLGSGFFGLAVCYGLGAVLGAGVQLALDGLVRWLFPTKPSLSLDDIVKATEAQCPTTGMVSFSYSCKGTAPRSGCYRDPHGPWTYYTTMESLPVTLTIGGDSFTVTAADVYPACAGSGKTTAKEALEKVPPEDLKKPVNPQIVAALANALWKQASDQPGYAGVKYDPTVPVTAADVSAWNQQNPDWVPNVQEFGNVNTDNGSTRMPMPNGSPGGGASPGGGTSPGTSPGTNPGTDPRPKPNPGPDPGTNPGANPKPKPNPSPDPGTNPGTKPNPGTEPGTDPGTDQRPKPNPGPDPGTSPGTNPGTNPGTEPGTEPGNGGKPTPPPDVCAKHPDISACAKLGAADAVDVGRNSKGISLGPISVGLNNGVCPVPYEVEVFGAPLRFSFDPMCQFAEKLRPLVLALGALLAGIIFVTGLVA